MEYEAYRFAARSGRELNLDVFRSAEEISTRAAVLLVHGGGWRSGSRKDMHKYVPSLLARGLTAVAIEYRLIDDAPWPAQLEDLADAVSWCRESAAALGIDPDKIALEGFSAGGHLSLLTAGTCPGIAAVIAFFPPISLVIGPAGPSEYNAERLLGPDAESAVLAAASPIQQVTPDFPPTFLIHGTSDWVVNHAASLAMFERLHDVGVSAELHLIAAQHHEFSATSLMIDSLQQEVANFLDRQVCRRDLHDQVSRDENPFTLGREQFLALHAPS